MGGAGPSCLSIDTHRSLPSKNVAKGQQRRQGRGTDASDASSGRDGCYSFRSYPSYVSAQLLQQRRRHEALTGRRRGGGGGMSRRHGRFRFAGGGGGGDEECAGVAVVDQADCTAQSCRSCVAVSLADCIALGCCPCAVVSLLGLAFVKLPLAVARRCARRLRRRQGRLRQKKRVRDLDAAKNAAGGGHQEPLPGGAAAASKGEDGDVVVVAAAATASPGSDDAENVWLELYQVGRWGFGRLSVSAANPPVRPAYVVATARNADLAADGDVS
uniref:Uncharacterized protein n=1 Tax=Oryza meridionalis TaxID=40149 RepID=A0A0E0C5M0_9ORYZ